jgi:hypothetical protein
MSCNLRLRRPAEPWPHIKGGRRGTPGNGLLSKEVPDRLLFCNQMFHLSRVTVSGDCSQRKGLIEVSEVFFAKRHFEGL